jgi:hypothetical protein
MPIRFPIRKPSLAVLAVGAFLWTGCTGPEEEAAAPEVTLLPARILSFAPGSSDTSVTLVRYDSRGMRIREIRSGSERLWDSLGRYLGVKLTDSNAFSEHVEWFGADSAVRTQGSIVIRDRFYNARPNCWCADSIRHTVGDSVNVTRKFFFDARDKPVRVTLTWHSAGSHTETVQLYENLYDEEGKLIEVFVQDAEGEAISNRIVRIAYDTLKNLVEARLPAPLP